MDLALLTRQRCDACLYFDPQLLERERAELLHFGGRNDARRDSQQRALLAPPRTGEGSGR